MQKAVKGELDRCIKCGICTANCPVANNSEAFSGPKHMGPELTRFSLDKKNSLEEQVDYCCNCRSCELACPSGVKVSLLNACYKSEWKAGREKGSLRDNMLGRPELLAKLGSFHVGLTNFILGQQLTKSTLEKTLAISKHRSFPTYREESFDRWFRQRKPFTSDKKVVYFAGCYTNYNQPEVGRSVVQILERNGYQVIVPEQNCCGLPLVGNGYLDAAQEKAEKNLNSFLPYVSDGYKVIASCTSCGLTLKSDYEELFGLDNAKVFAANVYDFSEFLLELKEQGQLDTRFKPLPLKLAYHTPCHLKAQGIGQPSLDVLRMIPGLEVVDLDQGCCGLSGSYGFKKEKYAVSMNIGQNLFNKMREFNPDYGVTDCGGCGLQISHGTGKEVLHPAVLVAKAYNYDN